MGLTSEEVRKRIDNGQTNHTDISTQKTVGQIVKSNLLTYFNLIFLILTVLLCIVGSFRNLTFLPVIIGNTVIGIFQELRAKKTLDKMSMLNAPHSIVVRDGEQQQIQSEELVKDDIIILSAGNQICADATVLSGSISVNEALLTGEQTRSRRNQVMDSCPEVLWCPDSAMPSLTRWAMSHTYHSSQPRRRPWVTANSQR